MQGIYKGVKRISIFFKIKDNTPRNLQSNIVYAIKCKDCDAEYVGKTTQHIETRLYQHKMIKGSLHGQTQSHIMEHAFDYMHNIDWNNFSVLARASNDFQLKIKESLLIKQRNPTMNNNETSVELNLF